jgi:tyrosine-protein phosphatase YwqE
MFSFFRKREKQPIENHAIFDWSFLKTDIHSHLIPGIDDGVEDLEQSMQLLRSLKAAGFSKVITTPHISQDYFPNKESEILAGLEVVRAEMLKTGLDLELHAAAEYMIDETFLSKLANNVRLLTLDGKHVLFEMGFVQVSPLLMQVIFELQARGYIPVLAHPERYNFYIENNAIEELQKLKAAGCLLQMNTIALTGYYGKHIKKFAESIMNKGLYDFTGSDMHHERHLHALQSVLRNPISQNLYQYPFLNRTI